MNGNTIRTGSLETTVNLFKEELLKVSEKFWRACLMIIRGGSFDISCTISFKLANSSAVDEDKHELSSNFSDSIS
jgi:hypothetical protein